MSEPRFPLSWRGAVVSWKLLCLGSMMSGRRGPLEWLRLVAVFSRLLWHWWRLGGVMLAMRRIRPGIDEEADRFFANTEQP